MKLALAVCAAMLAFAAPAAAAPPQPVISGPAITNQTSITFSWTAVEGVTYTCALDAAALGDCTQPVTVTPGDHVYAVHATDPTGSSDGTFSFTVDTTPPDAPAVTVAATSRSPVQFTGTAEAGGTISITAGAGGPVTAPVAGDGTWSASVPALAGAVDFSVTVKDAAGNVSPPTAKTVQVVPPDPPVIESPAEGFATNSTTVTLSGTAEAESTVTVDGQTTTASGGRWTLALTGVSEGSHAYTATATDAAGNVSAASAARTVVVDLTRPPAPVISGGPDGFVITAAEGTLDCRLDSAAGPGAFGACGTRYDDLAPGDYTLVARATDAAGNSSTASRAFTLSAPVTTTPPVVISPSPSPTPVAVPAFRQSVVLRPATGRTLIRRPGDKGFAELRSKTTLPLGTTVDVKDGTAVLTAAPAPGAKTETAKVFGGVFTVTQPASGIELALSETLRCGRTTRQLVTEGAGTFRIRGRYGTATGRGAKWQVVDSCSNTTIRVTRGVVAVRGQRTKKTILVRAGRHYTAQPKR